MRTRYPRPLARGFIERAEVSAGCWRWTGTIDPKGYGRLRSGRQKNLLAHRVSYLLHRGPIPEGLTLDHLCRNRWCVNPDHLEAVTAAENALRGMSPTVVLARENRCKRGHTLTEADRTANGRRECHTCKQVRDGLRRAAA